MRIFLTGATGYIGSATLEALLRGGHHVTALVRTREQAARLAAPRPSRPSSATWGPPRRTARPAGAQDRVDPRGLRVFRPRARSIRIAVDTLLDAAERVPERMPGVHLGHLVLGHQRSQADEETAVNPAAMVAWRPRTKRRVLDAAGSHLRTAVVRPGISTAGRAEIVGDLFKDARNGLMPSWQRREPLAAVYDRDLGDLYAPAGREPVRSGVLPRDRRGPRARDRHRRRHRRRHDRRPRGPTHADRGSALKMGAYATPLRSTRSWSGPRARSLGWSPGLRSVAANTSRLFEEWRRGTET